MLSDSAKHRCAVRSARKPILAHGFSQRLLFDSSDDTNTDQMHLFTITPGNRNKEIADLLPHHADWKKQKKKEGCLFTRVGKKTMLICEQSNSRTYNERRVASQWDHGPVHGPQQLLHNDLNMPLGRTLEINTHTEITKQQLDIFRGRLNCCQSHV